MRQIKFRGRRVDSGEFVYGSLILAPNGSYNTAFIAIDEYTDNDYTLCGNDGEVRIFSKIYPVIPETVGQFTGLRDSKRTTEFPEGQEIYDKDLISDGYNNIGIVEWLDGDNPGFYLHWTNVETGCFDGIGEWGTVVGNKFQHPELLAGENN